MKGKLSITLFGLALTALALSRTGGILPAAAQTAATQGTQVISAAELRARRDRIRSFFQSRLQQLRIVATTATPSGQTIDWIYPESQTASGALAQPPEPAVGSATPGTTDRPQAARLAQTEVQLYPSARGPDGTVPVVRFDVEKYLASIRIPPEDPRDVLRKMPPPAPDANKRYYVTLNRFGAFYGISGFINIWDTVGPVDNETSIAQVLVGRGTPLQTIEAGKIEHQGLNGDLRPHFFTYYTTNGHGPSGDWVGGYNALCKGWVQVSPNVAPGMLLTQVSVDGGVQAELDVEIFLYRANWWVKAAGEMVGYYPGCLCGYEPPECYSGWLFSADGLRSSASRLSWYGEVFDGSAPRPTSTDMGSGSFPSTGRGRAAYFRNLTFVQDPINPLIYPPQRMHQFLQSGSPSVTDGFCYNGSSLVVSTEKMWRNYFLFGGPGAEGPNCR